MPKTKGAIERFYTWLFGSAGLLGAKTPQTPPNPCDKCRLPAFFETLLERRIDPQEVEAPPLTEEEQEALEYSKLVQVTKEMEQ